MWAVSSPAPAAGTPVTAPHGLTWALIALALGGIGIGTGEFVPMGLLPEIADGVNASITQAGHVVSAYAIGVVIGAPLLAVFGSRLPRRRLLLLLMVAYFVGNVASAVAPTYETLFAARLLTGLPHGAFFGVASLAAASMVPANRRAWAITRVMLGLSIANVAMVPAATAMGHQLGWRAVFWAVAATAALTIIAIARFVPVTAPQPGASVRGELGALKRPQVLLTVAAGAIGFGGMFAVYSYIAPTLTERTGVSSDLVPIYLVVWGAGMVSGNLIGGHLIDRALLRTLGGGLALFAVALALFPWLSLNPYGAALGVFLLGHVLLLGAALQTRLMDVAGEAQTLAAAMVHASFNAANALGPWLAGLAYTATATWASPSWVGVALALAGLLLFAWSVALERRDELRGAPAVP